MPDLNESYRHAKVLNGFLNHFTDTLGKAHLGFSLREAPTIRTKREEVQGRLELHWVKGEEAIAGLRLYEAECLAERLKEMLKRGYRPKDMAVLARSYHGLSIMEGALLAAGLPYVLLQGRGYYARLELRDLYHALSVGIEAKGLSLAAFLRSPFAQLKLNEIDQILKAADTLQIIESDHPEVFARIEAIRKEVRTKPLRAIKFLIRELDIEGKHYLDFLDPRARENVDALLFTIAEQPPGDMEILLERLDLLSQQQEMGDVPQSGEGISLLTIHRAKGLEWPVVALFDTGRGDYQPPSEFYIELDTGKVALTGSELAEALKEELRQRQEEESYRLLYVALSRAKDVLLVSGSVGKRKPDAWIEAFNLLKLGPDRGDYEREDVLIKNWRYQNILAPASSVSSPSSLKSAPWTFQHFKPLAFPPVYAPTKFKHDDVDEPVQVPLYDPEEGEKLPGKGRSIGTLVHYAISQNWQPNNALDMDNLRYQEVMFPFLPEEQEALLEEVKGLLGNYYELLPKQLIALEKRDEDLAEIPVVFPYGGTIWQGIIDRMYRAGSTWYLEDYKTDVEVVPERYHFQLGIYVSD
ncbi:MAG: 3'-5' exonuclease [Deinococcales bacterium]